MTNSASKVLEQAFAMHGAGKLAAAEELYNTVLRLDPNHPGAHFNIGQLAARRADYPLALQHLRSAWRSAHGNLQVCHALIECLLRSGAAAEAAQLAADAAKTFAFSDEKFNTLRQAAEKVSKGVLPPYPEFSAALQAFEGGNPRLAAKLLKALIEKHPEWKEGWLPLGASLFLYVDAPALLNSLDVTEPDEHAAAFKAFATQRQQTLDEAIACLDRVHQSEPGWASSVQYRAKAVFERDKNAKDLLALIQGKADAPQRLGVCQILSAAEYCETSGSPYVRTAPRENIRVKAPEFLGESYEFGRSIGSTWSNESYYAELRKVSLFSKSEELFVDNGVVVSDRLAHPLGLLCDATRTPLVAAHAEGAVLLDRRPYAPRHLDAAVHLTGVATHEFGHWMGDYLPRIQALEQHPEFESMPLVIDAGMPASHIAALQLIIGESHPLLEIPVGTEVRVERLLVSASSVFFPYHCKPGTPASVHIAPSRVADLQFLRSRILERLPGAAVGTSRGRRIFFARNSTLRQLINQEEIAHLLCARYGFELVVPEKMSFAEQVQLFSEAECVVGPNSSAFANVIFCPTGAKIVNLCQSYAGNFPAWSSALGSMGFSHLFVAGTRVPGSARHEHHLDYAVPTASLERALQSMGISK